MWGRRLRPRAPRRAPLAPPLYRLGPVSLAFLPRQAACRWPCHITSHQGRVTGGAPSPWLPPLPSLQVPPASFRSRSLLSSPPPLSLCVGFLPFSPCPGSTLCLRLSPRLAGGLPIFTPVSLRLWCVSCSLPTSPASPHRRWGMETRRRTAGITSSLKSVFFERHLPTPPQKWR